METTYSYEDIRDVNRAARKGALLRAVGIIERWRDQGDWCTDTCNGIAAELRELAESSPAALAPAAVVMPSQDEILLIFAENAECSEQGDEKGYVIVRDQHAMNIARQLLSLVATPWVPVAERQPESQSQVLCWFGNKQRVAMYVEAKGISTDDRPFEGDSEYDEATDQNYWPAGWYCYEDGMEMWMAASDDPSHWTPLPEPPTK